MAKSLEDFEKKFKEKDGYGKMRAMNKMADLFGVDGVGPGSRGRSPNGMPGARYGSQHENTGGRVRNHEDVYRDINNEMVRSGAGMGAMYGGGSLPNANDPAAMFAFYKQMEKDHKKNEDGNTGGSFNNLSDVQAFVDRKHKGYMEAFKEDILSSMPKTEEQPSEQTPGALKPDPRLSQRMQDSQDFVNQYKLNLRNGNITEMVTGNRPSDAIFDTRPQELGSEMSDMPGGTGTEDIKQDSPLDNTASQVFSDKYVLGLKDTMKKNGMPTRGPGLLATMQIPTMGMM